MKGGCWGHVENLFASIRKTIILDMDAKEVSTEISKVIPSCSFITGTPKCCPYFIPHKAQNALESSSCIFKKQKMEEHRGSIVSVVTEWIAKFGIRLFF